MPDDQALRRGADLLRFAGLSEGLTATPTVSHNELSPADRDGNLGHRAVRPQREPQPRPHPGDRKPIETCWNTGPVASWALHVYTGYVANRTERMVAQISDANGLSASGTVELTGDARRPRSPCRAAAVSAA